MICTNYVGVDVDKERDNTDLLLGKLPAEGQVTSSLPVIVGRSVPENDQSPLVEELRGIRNTAVLQQPKPRAPYRKKEKGEGYKLLETMVNERVGHLLAAEYKKLGPMKENRKVIAAACPTQSERNKCARTYPDDEAKVRADIRSVKKDMEEKIISPRLKLLSGGYFYITLSSH